MTASLHEPLASCGALLACLRMLGEQYGSKSDPSAVLRSDSGVIPISRVIELAAELGLQAKHAEFGWDGLTNTGFRHPILIFLKSTNLVIVMGSGLDNPEEVAVWSPFRRMVFLARRELEEAWTGHALIVTPLPPEQARTLPSGSSSFNSRSTTDQNFPGTVSQEREEVTEGNRDEPHRFIARANLLVRQLDGHAEEPNLQHSRTALPTSGQPSVAASSGQERIAESLSVLGGTLLSLTPMIVVATAALGVLICVISGSQRLPQASMIGSSTESRPADANHLLCSDISLPAAPTPFAALRAPAAPNAGPQVPPRISRCW